MPNEPAENMLYTIHEDRIQGVETKLSDLESGQRAHEEIDALRFQQIGEKIDVLGERVIEKIDGLQTDVDSLKRRGSEQDLSIRDLKSKETRRKQIRATIIKWMWPAIAVMGGAIGHHIVELISKKF